MGPGSRSEGPGGYQRPTKRARTGGRGRENLRFFLYRLDDQRGAFAGYVPNTS